MTNLYFPIVALAISFFINILFFAKKRVENEETKIFSYLLLLNLLESITACLIIFLAYEKVDTLVLSVLNRMDHTIILVWVWLMFIYIYQLAENRLSKRKIVVRSTSFLNIILTFIFFFTNEEIVNDGDLMNVYGMPINTLYISSAIYVLLMLIIIIFKSKKIATKKNIPVYIFVLLSIMMLVIRQVNPSLLLLSLVLSFICLIMYHTIENPDVKVIEQLSLAKTTAEKANRAKSDFLSSMSHEIRTPLNAIVGFSECIKQANNLEEAKDNANDVITASQTLLEIVNGILDISKIESGKLELVETDYDTRKLFKEVERLIIARIGDKQLDFKVNIAPDIPPVLYGDHFNIKKILINLLTNAVKYTDKGYVLLDIKCVNNSDACRLIISVKDTGRGIKKENINKLFTKFNRLDEDKNTTIEGTGLGLAITKQLVDMMNGKIVVNSIYGEGSNFTVAIDQKISLNNIEIEEQEENLVLDLKGKNILIVDDNKLNLKVASKLLMSYNPNIDICENGIECLDKINLGNKYDLILMDDMMPKLRGSEVLKKLKENPNFNTPVIALTANAISGIKEQYLSYGFNDYLSKPIDKQELYDILKKFVCQNPKLETKKENIKVNYNDYSNKKVLIVDDNTLNIKIATKVMSSYNFKIEEAHSGIEAIEKIKNNQYDLIFMDIMMPNMDGVETLKRLKENKEFNIPVVALTADAVNGAKERYLNNGFNDYISKPINPLLLDEVINKIFSNNISTRGNIDYLRQNQINIDKSIEILGDLDIYNEMLNCFIEDINKKMTDLKNYIAKNDMKNYAIVVHSLKSDCDYLGFIKLAHLSYQHELKSKENDLNFIVSHYNELLNEVNNIINIINKY